MVFPGMGGVEGEDVRQVSVVSDEHFLHVISSGYKVESQALRQRDFEIFEQKFFELRVGDVDRFPVSKNELEKLYLEDDVGSG